MNRRILLSSLMLAGVAGLAGLGTTAFFSDTETSTNNYFQAGAIDLTVDAKAYYSGFECTEEGWRCDPWADMVYSFTQGKKKNGGNIPAERSDPSKTLGQPENNDTENFYSLGLGLGGELILKFDNKILNGDGADLRVVETSFGSPSCASYPEKAIISASKDGVNWEELGTICQDATLSLPDEMDYAYYVRFEDVTNPADFGSGDADGYDVDGIEALHCDSEPAELSTEACAGSWSATDLGYEHQLFDINDAKPGDYGRHSWSLHVEDNDAYACVMPSNLNDDDNGINEPEDEVYPSEPENDGTVYGDLSRNIQMIAWIDDGDAIWELSENLLMGPVSVNDAFNNPGWQLPEMIPGGETAYVGVNWCFGNMTIDETSHMISCDGSADLNIAQTDTMTADISFYVEQARHNSEFSCPVIPQEEGDDEGQV